MGWLTLGQSEEATKELRLHHAFRLRHRQHRCHHEFHRYRGRMVQSVKPVLRQGWRYRHRRSHRLPNQQFHHYHGRMVIALRRRNIQEAVLGLYQELRCYRHQDLLNLVRRRCRCQRHRT